MDINKDRFITNVSVDRTEVKEARLIHGSFKTINKWYDLLHADIIMTGALINTKGDKNGIPIESYISDGKVLSTSSWCKLGFGTNYDGSIQFGEVNSYYRDFTSAFPMLVYNGKAGTNFKPSGDIAGINPRAIFSQVENGFLLTTIDGRQKDKPGMNISDTANYMSSLGVLHASNMDGGGAVILCVNGKVINSPCENRPLSNVIAIWLKKNNGGKAMKKICIDAGHNNNGWDTGAAGNGLREQDVTFEISKLLGDMLTKNGNFEVKHTRNNKTDNLGVSGKTISSSCYERAKIANDWKADLFISIHCNSFTSSSANGTECWVYKKGNAATPLAEKVVDNIVNVVGTNKRGTTVIGNTGLIVLRETNMPAILVETAFISNANDANKLKNNQKDFAFAIYKSLCLCYNINIDIGQANGNKYSYDDTVEAMILNKITTLDNMVYWEKVLAGKEIAKPEYIREILNKYNAKLKG